MPVCTPHLTIWVRISTPQTWGCDGNSPWLKYFKHQLSLLQFSRFSWINVSHFVASGMANFQTLQQSSLIILPSCIVTFQGRWIAKDLKHKKLSWTPNLQYFRMGPYLEMDSLQTQLRCGQTEVGWVPNPIQCDWCPCNSWRGMDTNTGKKMLKDWSYTSAKSKHSKDCWQATRS